MSEYNIFLASPRGESESTTEEAQQAVYQRFCTAVPNSKITIVRSSDEFDKSFKVCGGWDEWTTHVATGVDYEYRTPLFNAIVSTTETVGKATAQIIEKALGNRRMVAIVGKDKMSQVVGVEVIDSDNWQTGWRLTVTS